MRQQYIIAPAVLLALAGAAAGQTGGGYDLTWNRIAGGGGASGGGSLVLIGTVGQHEAGQASGGSLSLRSGFWVGGAGGACYANCDSSTTAPILNVADFTCFLQRFAAADPYANCDGSTTAPVLNVADFTCFLQRFAAGCP